MHSWILLLLFVLCNTEQNTNSGYSKENTIVFKAPRNITMPHCKRSSDTKALVFQSGPVRLHGKKKKNLSRE